MEIQKRADELKKIIKKAIMEFNKDTGIEITAILVEQVIVEELTKKEEGFVSNFKDYRISMSVDL